LVTSTTPPKENLSARPKELKFGNLYDTAKGEATLAFNITSDTGLKVNWDQFIEKYPDLSLDLNLQGFSTEITPYLPASFESLQLSDLTDGKYNLSFKIDKKAMIEEVLFGKFTGQLALSIHSKELEEKGGSIEPIKALPLHFSFIRPEMVFSPISLNLGSLEGTITRPITFTYNDKAREYKSNFTISIELAGDNPDSLVIGKHIRINGQEAGKVTLTAPVPNIELQFSAPLGELAPGEYQGKLLLQSDALFIKEPFIPWTFTVSPLPAVSLEFGEIEGPKQTGDSSYLQEISYKFEPQAVDKKLSLLVSVEASAENPSPLDITYEKDITPPPTEGIFTVPLTPTEATYGTYKGKIIFTGDRLQITGVNLKTDPAHPDQTYYEWQFKIPPPPWMKILIGAIIMLVLLIIIYLIKTIFGGGSLLPSFKSSKAVIPEETYLYIKDSTTGKREQVNLSGKKEVTFGKEGQYLADLKEKIILKAVKESGKTLVRLTVEAGQAFLQRAGSREEEPVVETAIYNRDVIKLGTYQIRVSAIYLEKY